MRRSGLGKLYDGLTPEERFRLDVLAMARGDAEDVEGYREIMGQAWRQALAKGA
jgi:hypothetical protein